MGLHNTNYTIHWCYITSSNVVCQTAQMPSQRTLKASRGIGEQPSLHSRAAPAVWRDENAPYTQEPTRSQLVETLRDLHTALRLSRQREELSWDLNRRLIDRLQESFDSRRIVGKMPTSRLMASVRLSVPRSA